MAEKVKAEISLSTIAAEKAIARLNKQLQSFAGDSTASIGKIDLAIGSFVGNLAADAAVKGLELLKDSVVDTVKEFEKYEQALRGVEKTTGLTGDAIQDLGDDFRKLSTEIPVSTVELLEIAEAAGALGVRGATQIKLFSETIARLGFASDIAGQSAAKGIARILNVTGEGIGSVQNFASSIVELGNNFAASESEILRVTTEVARGTQQFDIGASAAAGIATALKSLGVQAEAGGTSVTQSFFAIEKAIRKGQGPLRTLIKLTGLTREELKQTFEKDSLKVFKLFLKGVGEFPKELGGASAALERLGLSGVRLLKTIPTLAGNMGLLEKTLKSSSEAWRDNTALIDESDKAFDTLGGQFQIFQNNIDSIQSIIGEKLAPALKLALKLSNQFLGQFTSGSPIERLQGINKEIEQTENLIKRIGSARILASGEFATTAIERFNKELKELRKTRDEMIATQSEGRESFGPFTESEIAKTKFTEEQIRLRRRIEAESEAEQIATEEEMAAQNLIKRDARLVFIQEELGIIEAEKIAHQQKLLEDEGKFLEAQFLINKAAQKAANKQTAEGDKARLALKKDVAKKEAKIEMAKLSLAQSVGDAALALTGDNAVAALLLSKTFALVQIAINDAMARSGALVSTALIPYPANLAALAQMQGLITTQTALAVGAVGAQTIAGFARMQDGGIVGGNQAATPGPDNQFIMARRGEMFLNSRQQANTFRMINEGASPNSETNKLLREMGEALKMMTGSQTAIMLNGNEIARAVRDERDRGFVV